MCHFVHVGVGFLDPVSFASVHLFFYRMIRDGVLSPLWLNSWVYHLRRFLTSSSSLSSLQKKAFHTLIPPALQKTIFNITLSTTVVLPPPAFSSSFPLRLCSSDSLPLAYVSLCCPIEMVWFASSALKRRSSAWSPLSMMAVAVLCSLLRPVTGVDVVPVCGYW